MIYSFRVTATESRQVEKVMKIRAKDEEEAREFCNNFLKAGLDNGIWVPTKFGSRPLSNKSISKLLNKEEEV